MKPFNYIGRPFSDCAIPQQDFLRWRYTSLDFWWPLGVAPQSIYSPLTLEQVSTSYLRVKSYKMSFQVDGSPIESISSSFFSQGFPPECGNAIEGGETEIPPNDPPYFAGIIPQDYRFAGFFPSIGFSSINAPTPIENVSYSAQFGQLLNVGIELNIEVGHAKFNEIYLVPYLFLGSVFKTINVGEETQETIGANFTTIGTSIPDFGWEINGRAGISFMHSLPDGSLIDKPLYFLNGIGDVLLSDITYEPYRYYPYDPLDGGGPIYDEFTGEQLREVP